MSGASEITRLIALKERNINWIELERLLARQRARSWRALTQEYATHVDIGEKSTLLLDWDKETRELKAFETLNTAQPLDLQIMKDYQHFQSLPSLSLGQVQDSCALSPKEKT